MKRYIKYLLIGLLFLIFPLSVNAEERVVNIHLFYGQTCPHCAAEEKFFDEYLKDKDNVKLYKYEVFYNQDNVKLLQKVQKQMGNTESGVPYTVIGKKVIVGFSEDYTPEELKSFKTKTNEIWKK